MWAPGARMGFEDRAAALNHFGSSMTQDRIDAHREQTSETIVKQPRKGRV